MVQAQGLSPTDPYRTLHLDPRAPYDLVVEVYRALLKRLQNSGPGRAGQIEELYAAYTDLTSDPRRTEQQRQAAAATWPPNLYAVLCVDATADAEIIRIAHNMLAGDRHGAGREALDDAYRTLANPQLRARYDRSLLEQAAGPRPVIAPEPEALPSAPEKEKRGLFTRRKPPEETPVDPLAARLMGLRDQYDAPDDEPAEAPAPESMVIIEAPELVFTSGPRAGERVIVDDTAAVVIADAAGVEAVTMWRSGSRVMLRQLSRKSVRVGGKPPPFPVIVVEPGDEIEAGGHHMRLDITLSARAEMPAPEKDVE
jgi:hypothetical protein